MAEDHLSWGETLSEWVACAGIGLLPLFCAIALGFLTDDPRTREILLGWQLIARELILFCIITNAASVVIYVSKFNLLQTAAPSNTKLPSALLFLAFPMIVLCCFVLVAVNLRHYDAILPMVGCMVGTLPVSLALERWIGLAAHAISRGR